MEIVGVIIVSVVILLFIFMSKKEKPRQHTDEELRAMSFEEWTELVAPSIKSEKTQTLRILCRQLRDVKSRIDGNHPETMNLLNEQDKERSLARLQMIEEELKDRGEYI